MATIKVTLAFYYDTEEDISGWGIKPLNDEDEPIVFIKTLDDAEAVAREELTFIPSHEWNLKSEFIKDEYTI